MERLWGEYACYGGYPAIVLAQGEAEKRLMLEDVVLTTDPAHGPGERLGGLVFLATN